MTDITIAKQQLEATLATDGWKNVLAPALKERIAVLEKHILDPIHATVDNEKSLAEARLERSVLERLLKTPDKLLASLEENFRQANARKAGVNDV
jgi:hypothetical protein